MRQFGNAFAQQKRRFPSVVGKRRLFIGFIRNLAQSADSFEDSGSGELCLSGVVQPGAP